MRSPLGIVIGVALFIVMWFWSEPIVMWLSRD
jgi:hypothetical protein